VGAVNAANGAQRWQYSTGGAITAPLAVANGLVYVASGDTALYAILA
jgi:outer membrane protein assembly factor BamB